MSTVVKKKNIEIKGVEGQECGLEWQQNTEKQTKYWTQKRSQRSIINNVSGLAQFQVSGMERKCLEAHLFS